MHWNRKMRGLRRMTLEQLERIHCEVGRLMRKETKWMAQRLAESAGCPPGMAEGDGCRACRGDILACRAVCWLLAAEDAVTAAETGKEAGRVQ